MSPPSGAAPAHGCYFRPPALMRVRFVRGAFLRREPLLKRAAILLKPQVAGAVTGSPLSFLLPSADRTRPGRSEAARARAHGAERSRASPCSTWELATAYARATACESPRPLGRAHCHTRVQINPEWLVRGHGRLVNVAITLPVDHSATLSLVVRAHGRINESVMRRAIHVGVTPAIGRPMPPIRVDMRPGHSSRALTFLHSGHCDHPSMAKGCWNRLTHSLTPGTSIPARSPGSAAPCARDP